MKKFVGILLYDEAYELLSTSLAHYLQEGRIGKFIIGDKAENDGFFLNVTISPETVDGRIADTMEISIPLRFVKFIVSSPTKESLGFI